MVKSSMSDDNEMSRILDELDNELFLLIRTRARLADIVKRQDQTDMEVSK